MRLLYKTGPMESLRKWFYKPKRDDRSLLAQFFFADDALNLVAAELDSFDGRKDPERCSTLVNQLRHAQDRVLNITSQIMDQMLGDERVARGFRVKFPEDVLQDNLAGQLWFGAECLAAGSSIMHREAESAAMRPLARALTRSLETVRALLRERCLRALPHHHADDMLRESLKIFDRLFAEFELCYVSAMVPVKTPQEFEVQQLICVLFSETLHRALRMGLLTQEQVDDYDPALMFAIPRLAIITGLLIFSNGPLSIDKAPEEMSDMFRPFRTLLHKIRELLWTLERRELLALEQLLCTNEDIANVSHLQLPSQAYGEDQSSEYPDIGEFVSRFYADHASCRELLTATSWADTPATTAESTIIDTDFLPDNVEVFTPILEGMRRLSEVPEKFNTNRTLDDSVNEHNGNPTENTFQETSNEHKCQENREPSLQRMASDTDEDASSGGVLLPDQSLISSLNEQVTELTDKLSFIMTCTDCTENLHEQAQLHSFSTNDVSALGTSKASDHHFPTKEQPLATVPSTSHGYLIPNAISQEPIVLASLSHNNSAIFEEDTANPIAQMSADGAPTELGAGSASIANANLSSLLLTDDEFRCSFLGSGTGIDNVAPDADGSARDDHFRYTGTRPDGKVSFVVGYESDGGEAASPVDSGICTENTSLDRSPDGERTRDLPAHYMNQNRLISNEAPPDHLLLTNKEMKNTLERTFSSCDTCINLEKSDGDVTVEITYVDRSGSESRNEAGSSTNENRTVNHNSVLGNDVNINQDNKLMREGEEEQETVTKGSNHTVNDNIDQASREEARGPRVPAKQRTGRKFSPKNKKKKSTRIWSPGRVILENRSNVEPICPVKLNLDYFTDNNGDGSCWSLSSATSSFHSECADDEEIALALQAQELAARHHTRAKFRSSEDLIHRLFVCIAGVADQLQTNYAADLRNILKGVFLMNQTPERREEAEAPPPPGELEKERELSTGSCDSVYSAEEALAEEERSPESRLARRNTVSADELRAPERAPDWVPDIAAPDCMRCAAHFTAFRRRHHCRNCGKVFCASCSSNSVPLPRFGQLKPVRVCEECFAGLARQHHALR